MVTAKLLVPPGAPLQLSAGETLLPVQPKPLNTCSLAMVAPSLRSVLAKLMLCAFAAPVPNRLKPSAAKTAGLFMAYSLIDAGNVARFPLMPAIAIFGMARKRGTRYARGQGKAVKHFREEIMNEATRIQPATAAELGAGGEEFQNLHEFVRKARAKLNQNAWDYIVGAAETETTMRRNRMALDEIAFRPRVLRNVAKVDASVEVFGRKLRLPVMLAPVGALEIFDPGAGASVARAAQRFGGAHMLSSVTQPGLEKVAVAAPDALRIFQLYVRGDDDFVEDKVSRAIAGGYTAFCLTVDTAHYSRRERDIAKRYVRESRIRATGGDFQKGLEWRTVKLIKDKYKIPLVIKGIATAEDAAIALEHRTDS